MEMIRLMRDGTAEPVSRDKVIGRERGQGKIYDHEQDWQSYPVDPCVCVCFFFPFILDIKFVGRTSRGHTGGRSHRISHPPLSAVRALIFLARRIQSFLSLVDREVEFCVLTI